jgi:hypothetical protein
MAMTYVNDTETLSRRRLDIAPSSSASMINKLRSSAKADALVVRCECGMVLRAGHEAALVDKVRLHMGEFHPEVGGNIPADLILAMAEQRRIER